jgi:alkylation response protein AidB-like acyl-CoA dehydrogenase
MITISQGCQFVVPSMALQVVDRAMQAFGAEGLSQDQDLAFVFANLRTLRIADVSRYFELARAISC